MGNNFKFILEYQKYIENIFDIDDDIHIYSEIQKRTKFNSLTISEGLIFTQPIDKSINILRKRFSNIVIEKEIDGEISLSHLNDELGKYLPLITNLGYFISTLTIDGTEWIKDYNEKTKPLSILLEPKYDYEVNIPEKLYHASPLKYKDRILKNGLSPRSGNKLSKHPERIYLTDDLNNVNLFGNYLPNEKSVWFKDGYCIYSIDTNDIDKLYSDINYREGGFYIMHGINRDNIKLIKEVIK